MVRYVDLDKVIEEIDRRIKSVSNDVNIGAIESLTISKTLNGLKSFLGTIEVSNDAFIDKAGKLLERMVWDITYEDLEGNSVQHYDKMEFIEDFKNYMKGE